MNRQKHYEIDMVNGKLAPNIMRYAIPLMFASALQILFNATDTAVVGKFAGSDSLAAVGSTGMMISLIINVLMGFALGTSVLVSRYTGAGEYADVSETVHTSIAVSLIGGLAFGVIGFIFCGTGLKLMGTPSNVIDKAVLYTRIYFIGLPASALYNYGSAVLRAVGDTKRPMYFLLIAGVINVILNLIFVIVLKMDVAGVAIATVASQVISATLVILTLIRSDSIIRLDPRKLRINGRKLKDMLKIGLPAGIQGSMFSISNVVIQSSINTFGSSVVAAHSAGGNIEALLMVMENAFYESALTFTSQNVGARKPERIMRVMSISMLLMVAIGLALDCALYGLGRQLLSLFTNDSDIIEYGMIRMLYVTLPHFICGMMNIVVGMMRGIGNSFLPMLVSIAGVCGVRLIWVYTVFAAQKTLPSLYMCYPVSWFIAGVIQSICFAITWKRYKQKNILAG